MRRICQSLQIQPSQARNWNNLEDKLSQPNVGNDGSLHDGHPSILASVESDLLRWFFDLCKQGIMVSTWLIVIKAIQLNAQFRRKSPRAKELAVRRLLSSNRIVTRCVTHTCQRLPHAICQEALDFIHYMRDKVVGGNREGKYIINMDQTPIFFDMSTGRTLSQNQVSSHAILSCLLFFQYWITNPRPILSLGERTINGRTSTSQTLRATVAVTVTASGKMLKPLVVFKEKPGARIKTREFPTYPQYNVYACHHSAWMDETVMRTWIREVLKPYVEDAPEHIQPLLLLDSYKCHTMASVTGSIEALGVQIEIIPGGCTGLCQPVDVGIGKPLKSRARHLWEEWMIDQCTTNNGQSRPPSRLLMSQWISDSVNRLRESDTLVRNSWRHAEYSYFPMKQLLLPRLMRLQMHQAMPLWNMVMRDRCWLRLAKMLLMRILMIRCQVMMQMWRLRHNFHQRCLHILKNFHTRLLVVTLVGTILKIPTMNQDLHRNQTVINRLCFS